MVILRYMTTGSLHVFPRLSDLMGAQDPESLVLGVLDIHRELYCLRAQLCKDVRAT